jgi:hypothetical protein
MDSMRYVATLLLALAAAVGVTSSLAGPPHRGGGGSPGHGGGHWGGGYRPAHGHGYGGGWYGYPGYGFGLGLGLGYGAGWAVSAGYPWPYWGAPLYQGYYPYGYAVAGLPALVVNEDLTYVQQPPAEAASPPPRAGAGSWYYCTAPAGYYPYVQQCSRPWIAVQPQVPAR